MESQKVLNLLNNMKSDEYHAPDEYQEIIDNVKDKRIKKLLRENQVQERIHLRKVIKCIKLASK